MFKKEQRLLSKEEGVESCDDRREAASGLLDGSNCVSDDEYLRSIDGMVPSIQEARREADCNGVMLNKLDW